MSTLTISFSKAAVIEAVKADTFITSSVDRAADAVKNAGVAYSEAAGDDAYHEKKIERVVKASVSKFASEIAEFADTASGGITISFPADAVGDITIAMNVTSRYNTGLAAPLGDLALDYVVNMSIYGWWMSIKPELAKNFAALAQDALVYTRKCFAKASPASSSAISATGSIS